MTLEEALTVRQLVEDSNDIVGGETARVVTLDGQAFSVEWFEMNYWMDYQHGIETYEQAVKVLQWEEQT